MTTDRLQLLTIDDSRADALVLRSLLSQAHPDGFDLVHKTTADTGLAAIRTTKFDCVFLDYMLENDDGLELLREVRESGNDVPIIAVSGNGCEEVAVEALKLGAQDYMVKGILSPEAVDRALSNAMEKVALARQIKEKRQELEDFAHVAAHDLKSPLASVHALVTLLLDGVGGKCDEKAESIVRRVAESTLRMSQLLDAMLEYAEVGRSQKPLAPVDLSRVLALVLENLDAKIRSVGATVEFTQLPVVMGDSIALSQLLQNLIANAIKFCRDRSPVVTITAHADEDRWVVSITDNGIGIAEEDQQRIFAPFRRLHKQSEFEGSGIGLATCKRIVDQHGGQIRVESKCGIGTTFFFTLHQPDRQHEPFSAPRHRTRGQSLEYSR